MIVALDQTRDEAVVGAEITEEIVDPTSDEPGESTRYSCLLCGSDLSFNSDHGDQFDYFVHENTGDCVNNDNTSSEHRLAQEVICKPIYNAFPQAYHPIQLDIESRIGGPSDFLVTDVQMSAPYQVVIEIVNLNEQVSLRRRLKTLFANNYRVMLIVVTTGEISRERIEHHLKKIASIHVGEFDPDSLAVTLGSLITPGQIDPDNARWDLLPDYLS